MDQPPKEEESILEKLDSVVPAHALAQFDAFPKLPSTYKARSESRGFMTIFVIFVAFLLVLNDVAEYIWGWPDYEFSVDHDKSPSLKINLDMTVNMPCRYLSIDLRDAVGDRLYLTGTLRRDDTVFDTGKAIEFKQHAAQLSAHQAVSQSKSSRGLFDALLRRRTVDGFKPTYNHQAKGGACRIWGSMLVKRVMANLHVTTLGHGYASFEHVDHSLMNVSHVISEFSFGPYFPDMTQPLDYTFEVAEDPFVAYQYFLHVVPTRYIAPRSTPLDTNQYSVTHYKRVLQHNQGTPGIFFKFDLDALGITVHQRTTSLVQLLIRCVGVIGGIFVCAGYAIRITTRAVQVVSGADQTPGIVAAQASGAKAGIRAKWGGGHLRARSIGKMVSRGSGWVMEGGSAGGSSPYASYTNTPQSTGFPVSPYTPHTPYTPHLLAHPPPVASGNGNGSGSAVGLGFGLPGSNPGSVTNSPSPALLPLPLPPTPAAGQMRSPPDRSQSPYTPGGSSAPGSPMYGRYSPLPNLVESSGRVDGNGIEGVVHPPPPRRGGPKKDD
ncbi:hypothetical protein AX15_002268 [Amanita polypyramis BW_CC]|nr:hypothetical protein AX15_002268 [Amanita polypyramis BW_CC]